MAPETRTAGEGAPRRTVAARLLELQPLRLLGLLFAVAAAYAVTGKLSLGLAFVNSSVTAVWPPTGIAVAALLLGGFRLWPGVALGALAANLLNGSSLVTSALIMVGNTAAPVLAVVLVRLAIRRRQVSVESVGAVLALICLGGLASMTVSASLGTISLVVTGILPVQRFTTVWPTWWIGDAMGVVLGAPVLLIAADAVRKKSAFPRARLLEASLLIVIVCVVSIALFSRQAPVAFLVFPLVVWASLRFYQLGAAACVLIIAATSIFRSVHGQGPFTGSDVNTSLIALQAFNGSVALTALLLAALSRVAASSVDALETKVAERTGELAERTSRFQDLADRQVAILGALTDAVVLLDTDGEILGSNAAFQRTFPNSSMARTRFDGEWEWMTETGEPLPEENRPLARTKRTGETTSGVVLGCRRRGDHRMRWFSVTAAPIRDQNQETTGYVVSLSDVSVPTQQLRDLSILTEAGGELRRLLEPTAVLDRLVTFAAALASPPGDASRRSSLIYIQQEGALGRVHVDHDRSGTALAGQSFSVRDHPWVEEVVRSGRPCRADIDLARTGPTVRPALEDAGYTHAAYAPIVVDGKVFAVVTVAARGDEVSNAELGRLQALCEIGALALGNARQYQAVLREAMTDMLTGLANRRAFYQRIGGLPRSPFAILAIDIDDLKRVNDRQGHASGDQLIRTIARTMAAELRPGDLLARTGGDEFLALLPDASPQGGVRAAERILAALVEVELPWGSPQVSIGCAGGGAGARVHDVLAAADTALYRAKQTGKGRVEAVRAVLPSEARGPAARRPHTSDRSGVGRRVDEVIAPRRPA